MAFRQVHWQEGLFLRPHHFQAADRHAADLAARAGRLGLGQDCGIASMEIDPDALANGTFNLRSLRALLPDGTLVAVPDDSAGLSSSSATCWPVTTR